MRFEKADQQRDEGSNRCSEQVGGGVVTQDAVVISWIRSKHSVDDDPDQDGPENDRLYLV